MPEPVRVLADYSPFTMVVDAIRGILVYEMGFEDLLNPLAGIAIAVVAITLIDVFVYKHKLRRVLETA